MSQPLPDRRVIAAFPATGKSYYAARHPYSAVDSDSSRFSHRPGWPDTYLDHIRAEFEDGATVLVSSHAEVREALACEGIPFTLVYPNRTLREEYRTRMVMRGSPDSLIEAVYKHWHDWLDGCERQKGCDHIVLTSGQYLADVLEEPLNRAACNMEIDFG